MHILNIAAYGSITVEKKCGQSDCSILAQQANDLAMDECEQKQDNDSYTCTVCCKYELCNGAVAQLGGRPWPALLSVVLLAGHLHNSPL